MKQKRFSETQIMQILKQAEGGIPVAALFREHGMRNIQYFVDMLSLSAACER